MPLNETDSKDRVCQVGADERENAGKIGAIDLRQPGIATARS
jgi:hypothetical protein